jgi:hypothetical protein
MELNETIEKWKVNKGLLADKMGMPLGTFCNKLSPKHSTKFTDAEMIRLKLILKDMGVELTEACEVDFNDAMKVLVNNGK